MLASRNQKRAAVLAAVFVAVFIAPWAPFGAQRAHAGSGTGTLTGDAFVNSANPTNNMGGSTGMIIGALGVGAGITHGFVKFNMPAGLTGRVTVTSATFRMILEGIGAPTGPTAGTAATYSLFRLLQNWSEGTGANDAQTFFVVGVACAGASVSWNHANCGAGITWTTPGGTAFGTASAAASTTGLVIGGTLTFSSGVCAGTNLTCDVQNWIDNGNPFGWMITSSAAVAGQAQKFFTREGGSSPTLAFNFSCKAGYKDIGTSCTTCTDAANADCIITHTLPNANRCNDAGPPATTYTCTCDPTVYKNGTAADGKPGCVIGCSPTNHCRDNGDAAAGCTDVATGYTCSCSTGFVLNSTGTSCVTACPGTPDPCGAGIGVCTAGAAGTWTCACNTGYVSTGGSHPSCVDFNACDATAINNCTTFPSNSCVDEAPPSLTYHCNCGNPAMQVGVGANGKPACVDIDDCTPNHCRDGGDTGATCTDPGGITLGYSCTCSTSFWDVGTVAGRQSCVDVNECAGGNPCGNGVCQNVGSGGGYQCLCNTGYLTTGGTTPMCVHPTVCDGAANNDCVISAPGNTCAIKPPPSLGHKCTCLNPSYVASADKSECVLRQDACKVNHCIDRGDVSGRCVQKALPAIGYDCVCATGYHFDGTTCVDTDECLSGGNPCGHGTCNNAAGSYSCLCENGYHSVGTTQPTCEPNVIGNEIKVTVTPGSCAVARGVASSSSSSSSSPSPSSPWALAAAALVLAFVLRRRRRA
jgi:MYXO-CTERM domain-containing protein